MSDDLPPKSDGAAASLSPAMRQYHQFKQQHPEYVLFFRMGDFYEMFYDDARLAHRVLGVTLTSRSRGGIDAADAVPMAGVPFHAVEGYLRKMIAAGHRVALCEQMEDAALAKGVVRRDVTRLVSPGTLTDEPMLDGRSDNYLAAVAPTLTKNGQKLGIAWVELSTGLCKAASGSEAAMLDELARLAPAETLVPESSTGQVHVIGEAIRSRGLRTISARPGWQFSPQHAAETFRKQWDVATVEGFGFETGDAAVCAVAAVVTYLLETQKSAVGHLRAPQRHALEDHLAIDPATFRALEIDRTVRGNSAEGSLLSAIDRTKTPMGARLLRQWVRHPLVDLDHLNARREVVDAFTETVDVLDTLGEKLRDICDVERIVGRIAVNRAMPRDMAGLGRCLSSMPGLFHLIESLPSLASLAGELSAHRETAAALGALLVGAIRPNPAPHLREGGVVAAGYDAELDRLTAIGVDSGTWLANYQSKLAAESNILSLKVGYNKVFGYYIEVTESHKDKAPLGWSRKQTVKNAERYITAELKQFENESLGARDKAIALEQTLFERLRQSLLPHAAALQDLAGAVARLDVLGGLARLSIERRYCKPTLTTDRVLHIVDGRHPVLEQQLENRFVANDVSFGSDDSLLLITGPNMAGKSTFIRQVALIVMLAQIGGHVPAKSATIGLADKLFARIGASDELHGGQSTFMVEMTETANILNNATDKSLVILDEIGRGTSTLDGLSLAWAIAEHVAGVVKPRTLFATHYHELTDLSQRFTGVRNANVAVREWEDQVVFLHRIVPGGTDRSYGIHVARLAGVPGEVLQRARQLLGELAVQHVGKPRISRGKRSDREIDEQQMPLFVDPAVELRRQLASLDVDELSPREAVELLRQWKQKLGGKG